MEVVDNEKESGSPRMVSSHDRKEYVKVIKDGVQGVERRKSI
jgi:hypothetical protein